MSVPEYVGSNIPRGKAVFHALLPAVAFVLGPPIAGPLLIGTAAAMFLSVVFGSKASLFGSLYKGVVARAFKIEPGRPEALAPHRFAEIVGAVFLLAAGAAYLAGSTILGAGLALVVVALALLNAAAGICVGCQMYLLFKRLAPRAEES